MSPLPRLRDVVVYDQRGAGHSEPALCPDYNRRRRGALAANAGRRTVVELETPIARSCLAALRDRGTDPAAYSTAESAADLVDLRRALGSPTWDVYGESYGGLQALAALALDPEGIRSVVLDRPATPGPQRAERPLRIQRALDRLFAACAADAGCRAAFPDPAADLAAVVGELDARPFGPPPAGQGDGASEFLLDGAMLIHALAGGLNAHARMGQIPLLLHELRAGDRARAARELVGWAADRELDIPATLAIVPCNDQYGRRALAVEDSALAAVSPPVRSIIRIRSIRSCEPWIHRTEPVPLPMPDGSRTPVLMFVGEYDTSGAAPEDSRIITSLLGNTIVVVLPAQGHTGRPGPCVQHITLQFWRDPARPVDTSCVAGMPAVRFATQW